ncbi:MAG: polysaccharide deacetylase family protein [Verrucomicrobiota bacterium]
MSLQSNDRAVSALFRVFGGAEPEVTGDAVEISSERGMHLGEYRVLSVLVPVSLFLCLGDWLAGLLGMAGWGLALPLGFLALNVMPFLVGARSREWQWRFTLAAFLVWAVIHRRADGLVGVLAYLWIGVGCLNVGAWLVLGWQATMRWSGRIGIAWRFVIFLGVHGLALVLGWQFGWGWALAAGALIAAVWCRITFDPGSQGFGTVYRKVEGKEILITIDDGPDPHDTPLLLDLLDRHGVKAVFFLIGEKVRAYPELAREVVHRGHAIGNHTMTHPQASFWAAGPWRTRREIIGCQAILREVTGVTAELFRAPCGHRNLFTHPIAEELGLEVMAWNRRGYDAVEKDASKVLARILPKLTAGDIVLLHEATPIAVEVLSGVLDRVAELKLVVANPSTIR